VADYLIKSRQWARGSTGIETLLVKIKTMKKLLSTLFALIFILAPLATEARSPATGMPKFNGYSPREFVYGNSEHHNVVKNLMTGDASQLAQTYVPNTTGCTFTDVGSSTVITATSSGAARCYLFQTVTGATDPNKIYVFGGEFSNVVGTFTTATLSISATVDLGGGSLTKTANGRFAIAFSPTGSGAVQVRIGPGVGSDETFAAGDSITISNTYLYEIPTLETPPNEYVWKTAVLPYGNSNSTSTGNVTTGATTTQYTSTPKRADSILIIGDSFCNDSTDYAEQLRRIANRAVYYDCVSGADMADLYTQFTTWLANEDINIEKSYYQRPKTVIFGGLINNIQGDDTLATIQAQTLDLASLAKANGMIPVFLGATPFGQASSWNAGRQAVLDSHRAWMVASSTQLLFVDPYNAFLSPTSTVNMAQGGQFGVSGDGLHPVSGGMTFLAQLIERTALQVIDRISN